MKSWLKVVKFLLSFVLTLYIVIVSLLYFFQRDLLFVRFVDRTIPTPAEALVPEMQVIRVTTADGLVLHNWYAPPRDAALPVVVIFYGQGDFLSSHRGNARWLLDNGFGVLMVNYRGYSGDPGYPTEENVYKDARASLDYVKSQGQRISLLGVSLGSGIALRMATEYNVQSVVLFSPYSSVMEVAAWRFPFAPVRYLMKDRFDSLSIIKDVKAPVLMVMGRLDQIIPFAQAEALFNAANQPKVNIWIDDAYHVNYRREQFQPQTLEFLKTYATGVSHENPQQ